MHFRRIIPFIRTGSCVAAVLCAGCATDPGPADVRGIDLSSDVTTVFVGDSLPLAATPRDAAGRPVTGLPINFTSSDTTKARVATTGLVRGVSQGSVTISASTQGFSTQVVLDVRLGGMVGPTGGIASVPNVVLLRFPSGALQETINISFDSLQASGAPGLLPGSAFAVGPPGRSFGQGAALTIYYQPAGITPGWEKSVGLYQVTDTGWAAVNGSTANFDRRSVTAPVSGAGSYAIFAPGPVATVTVRPSSVIVPLGTSLLLACDVQDSLGNYLTNRPIAWSSADPNIITVTQEGRAIAGDIGITTVTATSGGVTGTAAVSAAFVCQCVTPLGGAKSTAATCRCSPTR